MPKYRIDKKKSKGTKRYARLSFFRMATVFIILWTLGMGVIVYLNPAFLHWSDVLMKVKRDEQGNVYETWDPNHHSRSQHTVSNKMEVN